jgi:putative ABC transport system permease protein
MATHPLTTEILAAVRSLRRAPLISASAILCIGLGIGATAALSSAINRALLQPLPFRDPDRLVTIYRTTPQFTGGPFAAINYTELARDSRQIQSMAAVASGGGLLTLPDEVVPVTLHRVTGNLFTTLGVSAIHGRLIAPADDEPGAPLVAVISEAFWRERLGADPSVVGRTIRVSGESFLVVGISAHELRIPHGAQLIRSDIWAPIRFTPEQLVPRRNNYLRVLGRLAPSATVASADRELRQLFDGIVVANPELRGEQVSVVALQGEGVRSVRTPLLLLFGAVAMVLLIAATNVASLLLARGVHRQRELAIRCALGGGRWELMRMALIESAVLAAIGLALGIVLARVGVSTIGALAAQRLPQLDGLSVDLRVIAFAVSLAVIVAALCGAVPAWRASRVHPQDALRGGRGGGTSRAYHRSLGTLVVAEVALSLVLLVGAGLVLKGFARLLSRDPGFDPETILTMQTTVSPDRYPDATVFSRYLDPTLEAIGRIPRVAAAGTISLIPYDNWGWNFNIRYEGQPGNDPTRLPIVENRVVSPQFFQVTRQRLLAGRLLNSGDRAGLPTVVVVNEALVKRDFPNQDPLGKRYHLTDTVFATIVGVVSNIRNVGPVLDPRPEVYTTYEMSGWTPSNFRLMIRVERGDPTAITAAVRSAIRSIDPQVAISQIRSMPTVIGESVGRARFYLTLLGAFAAVAMVLTIAGIYGVLSYAVAQRTREFGIRSALGSTPRNTLTLVTREGMRLIVIGVVLGLAGAAGVTRLLAAMLYGVSPLDPMTWALTTLTLIGVGLLASLIPAARATRVDPLLAIRTE